jgi:undecaprenyl-diphosphatase
MHAITLIKSVSMGIVEGITEFLPISSTGHLILTADVLNLLDKPDREFYKIFIQLGAVLAVAWVYRVKIANALAGISLPGPGRNLLLGILIAFLPAAVAGLLFGKAIRAHLFEPVPVALAFTISGWIILWAKNVGTTCEWNQ